MLCSLAVVPGINDPLATVLPTVAADQKERLDALQQGAQGSLFCKVGRLSAAGTCTWGLSAGAPGRAALMAGRAALMACKVTEHSDRKWRCSPRTHSSIRRSTIIPTGKPGIAPNVALGGP